MRAELMFQLVFGITLLPSPANVSVRYIQALGMINAKARPRKKTVKEP